MRVAMFLRYILLGSILLLPAIAYAKVSNIGTSPQGLASGITTYSTCLTGTLFRIGLILLPSAFALMLIHKFIQIERKRDTGEIYLDELLSLVLLGMLIAVITRFVFDTLEFFGVPVSAIIGQVYYCNAKYFLDGNILCSSLTDIQTVSACSKLAFNQMLEFGLKYAAFISRLFFVFGPTIVYLAIIGKAMSKYKRMFEQNKISSREIIIYIFLHVALVPLLITVFAEIILNIIYIDYTGLVKWFFTKIPR